MEQIQRATLTARLNWQTKIEARVAWTIVGTAMTTPLNFFTFNVCDTFNEIEFSYEQKELLSMPSELNRVLLCSNWWKKHYRLLDFSGTTNEEAIKKMLTFYKHKTFRRLVGDHLFFEGFRLTPDGNEHIVLLGS